MTYSAKNIKIQKRIDHPFQLKEHLYTVSTKPKVFINKVVDAGIAYNLTIAQIESVILDGSRPKGFEQYYRHYILGGDSS